MAKKNHELLGRRWDFMEPVARSIVTWRREEAELAGYPECESRSSVIRRKLAYPVLKHLGCGPITTEVIRKEVNLGVDMAVEYFDDCWWRLEHLGAHDFSDEDLESMKECNRVWTKPAATVNSSGSRHSRAPCSWPRW
jgi:hypothetical protein